MSTQTKPNITPGKCVMQKHPVHHAAMLSCPGWTQLAIVFGHKDDDLDAQGFANATLYCEAHNVANECGLSPRQLLERWRKSDKLLRSLTSAIVNGVATGEPLAEAIQYLHPTPTRR